MPIARLSGSQNTLNPYAMPMRQVNGQSRRRHEPAIETRRRDDAVSGEQASQAVTRSGCV